VEPQVEVVDDVMPPSCDGKQCLMIGQRQKYDVKPLFREVNDMHKTQVMSSSSRDALTSSTSSSAAVVWNSDERRRLDDQSGVARFQDNQHRGHLGNARHWPSVTPLDLSVTSRSVMTPRDDVTVRYSDLRRRLYDDKHGPGR